MSAPPDEPSSRAQLRRPWRLLFIAYVVLLEIGTHWPRLELPGEIPATDKSIHFVAFGIFTVLLFLTGWTRSRLAAVALSAAFALADEWSQSIPGLGRTVSGLDIFANLTGVASAGLLLWTSSPIGSRSNMLRQRRYESIALHTAAAPGFWWRVFAPVPVLAGLVIYTWTSAEMSTTRQVIGGCMIFGALWFAGMLLARRLPYLRTIESRRPCYECGAPIPPSAEESASCAHCETTWYADQWRGWQKPDVAAQRRLLALPIVGGLVLFGLGIVVVSVVFRMQSLTSGTGPFQGLLSACADAAKRVCRLPDSVGRVADLAFLNVVFTTMFRLYRARLGRWYDRAQRCVSCGHNLTGVVIRTDGTIRCSECGHETTVPVRRTEG